MLHMTINFSDTGHGNIPDKLCQTLSTDGLAWHDIGYVDSWGHWLRISTICIEMHEENVTLKEYIKTFLQAIQINKN